MSNPDDKGFFTGKPDPEHPPSPVPRVAEGGDGGGGGGSGSAVTPGGGTQTQRGKNKNLRDITPGGEQDEATGSSTKPRTRRKPDPSAANVTEPCSECGRRFWSEKALFGHMRCHPERQWRGVNPPPHLRRPQPPVDNLPLLPPPPDSPLDPPPSQGGQDPFQDAEREVATCLVMLANGPALADDASDPMEAAGATDVKPAVAPSPSHVHVNFPSSGTTDATPPAAPPPSQVHVNFPPSGATDAIPPAAPAPSQASVNVPPSCAADAMPPSAPAPSQVHANCRFECSSCKKVFGSHQALGGHRASHKNVKGCFAMAKNEGEEASGGNNNDPCDAGDDGRRAGEGTVSATGTEEHRCKVCNRVFSSGQALGGHQRGHCRGRGHEPEAFSSAPRSSDVPDLNLPPPPENSTGSSPPDPALDLKLGM